MRLSTFLPTLGLAGQALATGSLHRCNTQWPRNAGVASDAQVTDYFAKLASATKRTLLHETTGPEIGAEVGFIRISAYGVRCTYPCPCLCCWVAAHYL